MIRQRQHTMRTMMKIRRFHVNERLIDKRS